MNRRIILIVDDSEEQREILSRYVEFVGGRVVEAGNGEEAIRAAAEHMPDLILLDLEMPVMDGWGAVRRLKEDPATAATPVLALTGRRPGRGSLEQAGFCGHLEKPISPHRVVVEVERCIGRLDGAGNEESVDSAEVMESVFTSSR
jgi:CheY-like chemotaxis protein